MLIPALVAILISFIIPLIVLVRMSFNETGPGTTLISAWSLETYIQAVGDPYYWEIILNTLKLGIVVSVITIILSYPIALFLTKTTSKWKGFLFALAIGPLLTSQIARTFGWIALLGNEGAVNSALLKIGLIDTPLQMSNNFTGTVVALVEVLMPYALLGMVSGFSRVSTELELAAGVLGASPLVRFWRITLPLSLPGVFTGFLLVFVLTISSFVTPHLLGGGRVHVLATEIYDEATQTLNWPLAASLAVILLILFGVLVSVYQSLTKKLGS
ncbi:ABC transporter permease [Brevibacterium siliguriense]|uniref:ABC transporter permease n=1 Tax=Brevibacterium siliguriense TaxID=1136497 RepID=UPI001E4D8522|nr:ABC transporter permease [Brevibacterium siliguriense]